MPVLSEMSVSISADLASEQFFSAASSEYGSFEELSRNCRDDLYRAAVRAADDPHIL